MSKKIRIYTASYCPYCVKAKMLLDRKGLSYEEIDVTNKSEEREKLVVKAQGRKTVPQIFIGEMHVGGCDDLYEKEDMGELDQLLK
ncbi:MAG: glutaredoxin 3 [Alphaproteobacteria bacterium]